MKEFEKLGFPKVKHIKPKLLSDEIISMTKDDVVKYFRQLFDELKELTGKDVVIIGDSLPTRVLMPRENTRSKR